MTRRADAPVVEPVVVVRVGAAGGSIRLDGEAQSDGTWRFKRTTVDQTEMLLGDADISSRFESDWAHGWDTALELLDRYPWAMLHPLQVHPAFQDLVRVAVEMRLSRAAPSRHAQRARDQWTQILGGGSG